MERRVGRTLAAGIAGGAVGAAVASGSRKPDTRKSADRLNHATGSRPNHDTGQSGDTATFSKRAGSKVGAVLDTRQRVKDKAQSVKEQVKDMPIQAGYAVHSVKERAKENVSDFKRGMVEEKITRQQGRAAKQDSHRQTIAEKCMAMEKAKPTGLAAKGDASIHERPATTPVSGATTPQTIAAKGAAPKTEPTSKERPAEVSRESNEKPTTTKGREPAAKPQEQRIQVVRESGIRSQTVKEPAKTQAIKESVPVGTKTIRQTSTQKTNWNIQRNAVKKSSTHTTKKGRKK